MSWTSHTPTSGCSFLLTGDPCSQAARMPLCFLPSGWDVRSSTLLITTSTKPSSDHFLSILPSFSCSGCFVTVLWLWLIVSLLCHSLLALTDCISEGRASWWGRLGRCTKTLGDFTSYHFRLFVSVTKYLTRSKLKGGMRGGDGGSCGLTAWSNTVCHGRESLVTGALGPLASSVRNQNWWKVRTDYKNLQFCSH